MVLEIAGDLLGEGKRFGIVLARFNSFVGEHLLEGALDALRRHGAADDQIHVVRVPGSFEIPLAAKKLAARQAYDALICLGVLIRGATPHFEYIAAEVTKGLASVSLDHDLPLAYGVLTCDTLEQAIERAGSKAGNKGAEAAQAAIEMANLTSRLDGLSTP